MAASHLFELLRIALGTQPSFVTPPTSDEWKDIYALANQQGISGILFAGIRQLPKEQQPSEELIADWFMLTAKLQQSNGVLHQQALFATQTFLKHGFRSVIIKGQSLAHYYPDSTLRYSNDIDIWLDGSKEKIVEYVSSVKKPKNILYHHCDFNVIKGTTIEVHFTPSFFANPFINHKFQKWAGESGRRFFSNCNGDKINIPDDDFNIPYLMVHYFRHLIDEEMEIKPAIDIFYILRSVQLTPEKKKEYMHLLRSFGLGHFCAGVMYILGTVCRLEEEYMLCSPDKEYGDAILKEILRPVQDKGCLTVSKSDGNHLKRFAKRQINLLRFLPFYPKEILWTPYWSIKIFFLLHKNK